MGFGLREVEGSELMDENESRRYDRIIPVVVSAKERRENFETWLRPINSA